MRKRLKYSVMLVACLRIPTWCKLSSCEFHRICLSMARHSLLSFSEIRAQYLFEKETSAAKFPQYQDGSWSSNFKLGFFDYMSLLTTRSEFWRFCYDQPVELTHLQPYSFAPPSALCTFIVMRYIRATALTTPQDYVLPAMDWCQCHSVLCSLYLQLSWFDG